MEVQQSGVLEAQEAGVGVQEEVTLRYPRGASVVMN